MQLLGADARILWLLLGFTLLRAAIYALVNPPFYSPDEQAHFDNIAYLATGGASGARGAEAHQPLPYYLLMVPVYWLTAAQTSAMQLLAIRLASTPLLLGGVLFTWLAARKLAPNKPVVPIVAASIVALNPVNTLMGASANNDVAANFMAAVLTFLVVSLISEQHSRWTLPAMVPAIGAAVMTKGQILPVVAISVLTLLAFAAWQASTGRNRRFLPVLLATASVLLLAFATSGGQRFVTLAGSVLSAFDEFPLMVEGVWNRGREPFFYQFRGFWAHFIGDSVYPPTPSYLLPAAVILLGLLGYAVSVFRWFGNQVPIARRTVLARTALAAIVTSQWLAIFVMYMRKARHLDYQWAELSFQGRYLLVMLPALALLLAEGWSLLVGRRQGSRSAVFVVGVLIVFELIALAALLSYYGWQIGKLL